VRRWRGKRRRSEGGGGGGGGGVWGGGGGGGGGIFGGEPIDALRQLPRGDVVGARKIRAMEILKSWSRPRRGFYGGG